MPCCSAVCRHSPLRSPHSLSKNCLRIGIKSSRLQSEKESLSALVLRGATLRWRLRKILKTHTLE